METFLRISLAVLVALFAITGLAAVYLAIFAVGGLTDQWIWVALVNLTLAAVGGAGFALIDEIA